VQPSTPSLEHQALPQWPAIMSLETAAKYTDRSYDTLWLMVKRMEIPAVRHGARKFLRKVDIDAWAEKLLA
jgi:excisionase family DNA binding protein